MEISNNQKKIVFVKKSGTFKVAKGGELICVALFLGGRKKIDIQIELGEHSLYKFVCIFVGADDDQIKISVAVTHLKSNSIGETLFRGVLTDSAKCAVSGLIKMNKYIKHSSGLFSQKTLLLSEKAAVKSLPHLEISSQNIQAKHEVTVSRLDEEQLFYLMSRGIEKSEASKLIVKGLFSKEQKLLTPDMQKELQTKLQAII